MSTRLKNKVAVVTGGNSGIGRGIVERFIEEGAKLAILGRNKSTLDEMQASYPNDLLAVSGDISSTDDLKMLFQKTVDTFGKIDVLVANAGNVKRVSVADASEEDFDSMSNANYRGTFFTVNLAIPSLNKNASIILISSVAAHMSRINHSIYSSSKAAVSKLAQNFAFDLAEQGIRVNAISPGYIKTPLFDKKLLEQADFLEEKKQYIPLKKIGSPKDIANAALFLASEESSYITGTDLIVDGGFSACYPMPG
ncbi:MAG: oxidoreductase [marine bacterium B5-7]|nr:MAG: oxidoreductase [marine bacterium B5-7]